MQAVLRRNLSVISGLLLCRLLELHLVVADLDFLI